MSTCTQNRTAAIHLCRNIRHILTTQNLSQVPEILRGIPRLALISNIVQRKHLVVGQGEELRIVEKSGIMDGGVVVERLDGELVLVEDGCVVDADEAVGRARDEQRWLRWVEGQGGDVVAVDFGVGCLWGGVGADVPFLRREDLLEDE